MSRDVNLVRREMRVRWSAKAGHEHILETFLQVLMDEEFLSTLDETARRILIVDADEDRFANMGPSLTQSGYQVVTVGDPAAAESVFKDFEPNVVIVSMDFPRDAGLSLCKRIRRLEKSGGALVMALVSPNDNRMAAECLRVGADDFLTRPADLELLFLKLRSRLGEESHEASGVTGLLSEMNFNDMVQIFSAGRRSIMIHLTREAAEGRVWMREGQVVHAEAEDKAGEEAFYALMRWKSGEFKTQVISNFPEQSITVSTMSLLMEGSRQADEGDA